MIMKCKSTDKFLLFNFRLELEVEPIFASMALYDGRVKKKVQLLLIIFNFTLSLLWVSCTVLNYKESCCDAALASAYDAI